MIEASAPGKVILLGEHAVVYGRPAIALPLKDLRASTSIHHLGISNPIDIRISAPQIGVEQWLCESSPEDPLALAVRLTLEKLEVSPKKPLQMDIHSEIPISSGLGSGAAVSVAITRALSAFFQKALPTEEVSKIAFEVEKLHHGTPSGIDNTVVAYEQGVRFEKDHPLQSFAIPQEFRLIVADSGKPSPTAISVGQVRDSWKADPKRYEAIFDAIGALIDPGYQALTSYQPEVLGHLMNENHRRLHELGVSSTVLDHLVKSAKEAGALGAKLSGGGLGGVVIVLPDQDEIESLKNALLDTGAVQVFETRFGG